jgi:hypothetical protein
MVAVARIGGFADVSRNTHGQTTKEASEHERESQGG